MHILNPAGSRSGAGHDGVKSKLWQPMISKIAQKFSLRSIGAKLRRKRDASTVPELTRIQYDSMRSSSETYGNDDDLARFRVERAKLLRDSIPPLGAVEQGLLVLLAALTAFGKPAHVLDFGGSAGYHFFQVKCLAPHLLAQYVVVDLPELVNAARRAGLKEPKITAEMPVGRFDVVFTAGVLQCTDDPLRYLDRLLALEAPYLVLTRNFLSEEQRYFRHEAALFSNGTGPLPDGFTDRRMQFFFQSVPLNEFRKRITAKYDVLFELVNESGMACTGPGLYGIDYVCRLREVKT